jgi:Ca2+-transporting ATPase
MHSVREQYVRLQEFPFNSEQKYMAVRCAPRHNSNGSQAKEICFVKGAVERIIKQCINYNEFGSVQPMTSKKEEEILSSAYDLGRQGLRVLAMAKGATFQNLTFMGLVGMQDPPRPGVRTCIQTLIGSGIQVKMLTGDAQETAISIARMVGMDVVHGSSISGPEMDKMDDLILEQTIPGVTVFYRVAPKHKLKIVKVFNTKILSSYKYSFSQLYRLYKVKGTLLGCLGTESMMALL